MQRDVLETVWIGDPALVGLPIQWWQDRDLATLSEIQRASATIVRFERLTRGDRALVYKTSSEEQRYEWAFACGIREAGDWKRDPAAGLTAVEEECEERFSPALRVDVGSRIWAASILGKDFAGRSQLPPTSLLAWDAMEPARLSAAQSQG